jgi:PAS domain S-box-containing protein
MSNPFSHTCPASGQPLPQSQRAAAFWIPAAEKRRGLCRIAAAFLLAGSVCLFVLPAPGETAMLPEESSLEALSMDARGPSALAWAALVLAALGVGAWSFLLRARLRTKTEMVRKQLRRESLFSQLGGRLSGALTADAAARVIVESLDELLGWDACSLDLYSGTEDRLRPILTVDLKNGKRADVPPAYEGEPGAMAREIIESGAKLILRRNPEEEIPGLTPFGEMQRRSLSLLFVPIRHGAEVKGVLSIQSYSMQAYGRDDLRVLQALADFCGGTLERIRFQHELETQLSRKTSEISEAGKLVQLEIARQEKTAHELAFERHLSSELLDHVPDHIYFKDRTSRFIKVNRAMAQFLGLNDPSEAFGRTDFDFFRKEQAEQSFKDEQQVIQSGAPLKKEERDYLLDGREGWTLTTLMPLRDGTGAITGTFGISRDITRRMEIEHALTQKQEESQSIITELKQAQEELQRRERMLRNLYEGSGDAIFVQDLEGKVLDVNPAACRLHETSREQLIGRSMLDLVAPERRQEILELLPKLVSGERSEAEIALSSSGQRSIPVLVRVTRIEHDGQPAVLFQARDITEQKRTADGLQRAHTQLEKRVAERTIDLLRANELLRREISERAQAEQALRQSEARFSKAFRASPVSMGITTLSEGRFIDVNDIFLKTFGFTREEVVGESALDLGLWLDPAERRRLVATLHEQQNVRNLECRFVTKSGELRHTLASVEIIELGKQPHLLFITHDVTERLSLEAQLRHSQKMEAVGQLAAGVAHDFNNILTIVQGHANLLLASSRRFPELVDPLGQISAAVDRAANLTRQLLTFSRKQLLQPTLLDMSEVVGNATKMLNRLLGENIELQFSYSPSLPAVLADVGMMEQMIINLAVNARDAMPKGGQLTISTSLKEISPDYVRNHPSSRPGQFICLAVSDVGCGMDEATLGRIFEPFFTTKEIGKGTGLGLATVYGIVTQHQGWIEVTSQPGHGTTFSILLPAVPRKKIESVPAAKPLEVKGGTETILVVEDEPALRLLVRNVLRRYGYRVLDAGHGKEALKIWKEHSAGIHLLLTDMMMPEGMSGVELAEILREENPRLKVIYSSGYSVELLEPDREMTEGVNFVAKPFHPATLARAIRNSLDA